ncbi:MAG: anti-sigma factor family protein [Xanthobacteraceae bacterium]
MTHDEAEILVHALLDGELDAGHTRDLEAHLETCPRCAAQLTAFRDLRQAIAASDLRMTAPAALRQRIENALPAPASRPPVKRAPSRRGFLGGFALGTALSAVAAVGVVVTVFRSDQDQFILGDVVSAHLRSLQADHLTDVLSSDQHNVKPWFNGRIDLAPPVVDLTAQGFTLLGGRLDYVEGKPAAVIVYRRRTHVINLFAMQGGAAAAPESRMETVQGFNIYRWRASGLNVIAISDLNAEELHEFCEKFEASLHA